MIGFLPVSDAFSHPSLMVSTRCTSQLKVKERVDLIAATSDEKEADPSCGSPLVFTGMSFSDKDAADAKLTIPNKPLFVDMTDDKKKQISTYVEQLETKKTDCVICDVKESPAKQDGLPGAEAVDEILSKPIVELSLGISVLVSCFVVALSTLDLEPSTLVTLNKSQDALTYLFAFEFALRWYASWQIGPKYFKQPLVIVDLLANVVPLIVDSAAALINLRLLRITRFSKILDDVDTFVTFQRGLGLSESMVQTPKPWQLQLTRVLLSLFTLLSVATACIYAAEHEKNPAFSDYFTALYFGMTTLTTVGFGDVAPITNEGRFIVAASIVAGVAVVPAQAAALLEALMESQNEQKMFGSKPVKRPDGMLDALTPCPSCSATMHWSDAKFCWSCGEKLP